MKRNIVMTLILMYGLIFTVGLMAQGSKSDFKENKNDKDMKIIIETRTVKKEPTVETSKKVRTVMIDGNPFEIKAVEFLDKGEKVKLKIESKLFKYDRNKEKIEGTEIIQSKNKKFIVITKITSKKSTPEYAYKTGWERRETNIISLYDENGNKIMEKEKVDCRAIAISEDGKKILCFRQNPDLIEAVVSSDADLSKMAKIMILSDSGESIYEFEYPYITSKEDIKFSPNGRWIAFVDPEMKTIVIDSTRKVVIEIPYKRIDKINLDQFDGVTDNGELLYTIYKKGKLFAKYLFSPMTNEFIKLIEE